MDRFRAPVTPWSDAATSEGRKRHAVTAPLQCVQPHRTLAHDCQARLLPPAVSAPSPRHACVDLGAPRPALPPTIPGSQQAPGSQGPPDNSPALRSRRRPSPGPGTRSKTPRAVVPHADGRLAVRSPDGLAARLVPAAPVAAGRRSPTPPAPTPPGPTPPGPTPLGPTPPAPTPPGQSTLPVTGGAGGVGCGGFRNSSSRWVSRSTRAERDRGRCAKVDDISADEMHKFVTRSHLDP